MRFAGSTTLLLLALLCAGPVSLAQTLQQQGFKPVDPLIDDVDPLATSLRQHSIELQVDGGGRQRLFRRTIPGDPITRRPAQEKLYLIDRGVTAEFDRSDYVQSRKGRIYTLIPPNTVFHLGVPQEHYQPKVSNLPDPPQLVDTRISGQTNQTDENAKPRGNIMGSNSSRPIARSRYAQLNDKARANTHQRQQRISALIAAIDKIAETESKDQ